MKSKPTQNIIHLINNSNRRTGGAQKILWSIYDAIPKTSSIFSFREYISSNSNRKFKPFTWPFHLIKALAGKRIVVIHHRAFLPLCPILNAIGFETIFLCHNIFPNKNLATKVFKAKKAIAISTATQEYLKKLGYRKIELIENFIEIDKKNIKRQNISSSNSIRIAYIGRLAYQKGVDTLIEAHSRLKQKYEIETHIIGDGPLLASLNDSVKNAQQSNSIIFHGSSSSPFSICKDFEIVVVPSRWEGFGLVFFEAIAHKHFIIASDLEAFQVGEKLNEQVLLFNPGNSEDLEEKIEQAITGRAYRNYKTHEKLILTRFSKENQISKYKSLLNAPA
ncbi:Glycosyltransferase Gtf1 [compost metagenome]